jgi:hypothetical protein
MFAAGEDVNAPTWGRPYGGAAGAIAVLGKSAYAHQFGGESWRVEDPDPVLGGPTLLLTLDLRDPILAPLAFLPFDQLPLCSYISCDIWAFPQLYRIDASNRRLVLVDRKPPATEARFPGWAQPLPEKVISLTPMVESDLPTTEDAYWRISDEFVGGERFIRVLGPPLWVWAVATVTCQCGRRMRYVCAMGYEGDSCYSGLIEGQAVFFGEGAIYWFVCADCLTLGVISEPTS